MNDVEQAQFAAELRALNPARPPRHVVTETLKRIEPPPINEQHRWWNREESFGWLVPAAGMALVVGMVIVLQIVPGTGTTHAVTSSSSSRIKADQVELNKQLVANYDAVGRLPNG